MSRHVVAKLDDLPPGSRVIVEIAGREIGVLNVSGELYAIRNRCPHQGGPLCSGHVLQAVSSTAPGEYRLDPARHMMRCPWHQWEFDLRTGQSWFDPQKVRVKAYEANVVSGTSLLSCPEPELQPGPYVADVYPVTVDDDYVVVDLSR